VEVAEFCQTYYDSVVIEGADEGLRYWENEVFVRDAPRSSFRDLLLREIDPAIFAREMTALHFEVIGLAWLHTLKRDNFALRQAVFTKRYLEDKGHAAIWEAMSDYNQAVAQSSIEITAGRRSQRAWITFANEFRGRLCQKWLAAGVDPDCAARVANRELTQISWRKGVTPWTLHSTLISRLGYDLQGEGSAVLASAVQRFYSAAAKTIKSFSIQP
jgi:hypothetical protein